MRPIIDHIQITVKDMDLAVPFYDKFLPLLGFAEHCEHRRVKPPGMAVLVWSSREASPDDPAARLPKQPITLNKQNLR